MKNDKNELDKKQKENKSSELDLDSLQYPASEDIYNKSKLVGDVDPSNPAKEKSPTPKGRIGKLNEKDFTEDKSGDDLDIPGAELDDDMEEVGSEDEENNYYSLGGDRHEDLEESRE